MSNFKKFSDFFTDRLTGYMKPSDRYDDPIIINKIEVRPVYRKTQDIQKWRNAMISAESVTQYRKLIYDLYDDIMLDGFLKACIRKRVAAVTNRKIVFTKNGIEDEKINKLFGMSFFTELVKEIMNARFYGHSLVELNWPGQVNKEVSGWTKLVNRAHVKPRFGLVTIQAHDVEGYAYREAPFADHLIEVGGDDDLGDLLEVAQYVIYKRGNFGDWAEFAETFGMPFRWATYSNEANRKMLEEAMSKAGSAGYVVAPEDANLNFFTPANGQGNEIFKQLRAATNEEIAITILGNSMTTSEARQSGYAQGKVHQEVEQELNKDDRIYVKRILKEKVIPYLQRLGYDAEGGDIEFKEEETMGLKDRIEVDLKLRTVIDIPDDYFYETYRVPRPKAGEKVGKDPDPEPGPPDDPKPEPPQPAPPPKASKKKTTANLSDRIHTLYNIHAPGCGCSNCVVNLREQKLDPRFTKITNKLENDFLNRYYQGASSNLVDENLFREYYRRLRQFAQLGFGQKFNRIDDFQMLQQIEGLRRNLSKLASHKVDALGKELEPLLRLNKAEYLKRARAIIKRHNITWLKAETQTAMAAADSIKRWREAQDVKDLYPNLKYDAVNDARTRPEHRALDGAIYPVDDEFWDRYMPPNGYNCRCIVLSTDDPPNRHVADWEPPAGLDNNPGKGYKAFQDEHPYFESDRSPDIFDTGEQIRAAFELAENIKLGKAQFKKGVTLPDGRKLDVPVDRFMNADSADAATINSMLAWMPLIIDQATLEGNRLQVELAGIIWTWLLLEATEGIELLTIYKE